MSLLQSLCDHLPDTASVRAGSILGPLKKNKSFRVFGSGVELKGLFDDSCDDDNGSGGDLQSCLSADVCLDRRLPQVHGMQNIDRQATTLTIIQTKGKTKLPPPLMDFVQQKKFFCGYPFVLLGGNSVYKMYYILISRHWTGSKYSLHFKFFWL